MFGKTTIFQLKIWTDPIATTVQKWMFLDNQEATGQLPVQVESGFAGLNDSTLAVFH